MRICGTEIDSSKLLTKQELMDELKTGGGNDRVLGDIRDHYNGTFGNDLMWRYPISEGVHAGGIIVAVQEGFLWLPYDCMDKEDYEIFELDQANMLSEEHLEYFISDWALFSEDLTSAMTDMLRIVRDM